MGKNFFEYLSILVRASHRMNLIPETLKLISAFRWHLENSPVCQIFFRIMESISQRELDSLICFVRSRLTYSCQNWNLTTAQFVKLDITYRTLLRRMVRRGSIELILTQASVLRSITKSFIIFAILKMLVFLFENSKKIGTRK